MACAKKTQPDRLTTSRNYFHKCQDVAVELWFDYFKALAKNAVLRYAHSRYSSRTSRFQAAAIRAAISEGGGNGLSIDTQQSCPAYERGFCRGFPVFVRRPCRRFRLHRRYVPSEFGPAGNQTDSPYSQYFCSIDCILAVLPGRSFHREVVLAVRDHLNSTGPHRRLCQSSHVLVQGARRHHPSFFRRVFAYPATGRECGTMHRNARLQ